MEEPRAIATYLRPDGSVSFDMTPADAPAEADPYLDRNEFRVWFDTTGQRVVGIHLSMPRGLTPTVLNRFSWRRWLTFADSW